jgi:hypothetical protein
MIYATHKLQAGAALPAWVPHTRGGKDDYSISNSPPFQQNYFPLSGSCMDDENLQRLEQNSEIRTT